MPPPDDETAPGGHLGHRHLGVEPDVTWHLGGRWELTWCAEQWLDEGKVDVHRPRDRTCGLEEEAVRQSTPFMLIEFMDETRIGFVAGMATEDPSLDDGLGTPHAEQFRWAICSGHDERHGVEASLGHCGCQLCCRRA